jgi:hypothetical protein
MMTLAIGSIDFALKRSKIISGSVMLGCFGI